MRRPAALVLLLALALGACTAIEGAPPVARTYWLTYPAPAPAYDAPAGIVRVAPFSSAPVYDRLGFVYREGAYDIAVDNYNGWISPPAAMIGELVGRDLGSARVAAAVLQGPSALTPDYELSARVEELAEVDSNGCSAHLRLRALLTRVGATGPRSPVFEEIFRSEQPCSSGDPSSVAEAMSLAVQDVSNQLSARVATAAGK
jgi:ABC-type uncharacterized transport system auxiliary subunit